ncbi:MAG TPA: Smr/MutS family protein [Beijerinckiaceae bacterium]|nr:Smr/MutS family protein [Beijerinckiaceae bacterium]
MTTEREKWPLRRLTEEEAALWRQVTRVVAPRSGGRTKEPAAQDAEAPLEPARPAPAVKPRVAPKPRTLPAPTQIEAPLRRRLARGTAQVDDVLDLHGFNQHAAQDALIAFLLRNQALGSKLVLIVTGKGRSSGARMNASEGVLHRSAPLWLQAPALRAVVVGFEEASAKHGGSGALYVRIRKRRDGSA